MVLRIEVESSSRVSSTVTFARVFEVESSIFTYWTVKVAGLVLEPHSFMANHSSLVYALWVSESKWSLGVSPIFVLNGLIIGPCRRPYLIFYLLLGRLGLASLRSTASSCPRAILILCFDLLFEFIEPFV